MARVPDEPCARRTIFASFRSAAAELWGERGLRDLGERMPAATRKETLDTVVLSREWLPETHVLAWYEAAWEGPAGKQQREYHRFLDRMMDHGFGRVRRFLLSIAMTPLGLGPRCAELWRHDHTHGTLVFEAHGPLSMSLTLRDHPYLSSTLARSSIAEIYRYAGALTRGRDVVATHALEAGGLAVRIPWR